MNEIEIINDIITVATKLGIKPGEKISSFQYYSNGAKFSSYHIYDGGKKWNYFCQKAGYGDKTILPVSDEVYFQNLKNAVNILGRFPKESERKKFKLNFAKSRWNNLNEFIIDAIKKGYVKDIDERLEKSNMEVELIPKEFNFDTNFTNSHKNPPPIPENTKRKRWERINFPCFPYAPQDEQGVVAIFSILCFKGIFPWQIVDLNGGKGIDATCYDDIQRSFIKVEFKYHLAKHNFNHSLDSFDLVVCWINKWKDIEKKVIELKEVLKTIEL